jgi:hypothetical protein
MTSRSDRVCPGLHCAIRHGEVKAGPADPEAAACMGASGSIREVPEPQSSHASGMQMLGRGGRHPARGRFFERNILYENEEHNRARLVSRRTGTHVYEGCC